MHLYFSVRRYGVARAIHHGNPFQCGCRGDGFLPLRVTTKLELRWFLSNGSTQW